MATSESAVRFPNEDGHQLAGLLVEPAAWASSAADGAADVAPRTTRAPDAHHHRARVVVLVHGLYQHKNINMLRPFGAHIPAELGMASFRFDCRGLGESEGVTSFTP